MAKETGASGNGDKKRKDGEIKSGSLGGQRGGQDSLDISRLADFSDPDDRLPTDPGLAKLRRLLSESHFGTPDGVHERDRGRAEIREFERETIEGFLHDVFPEGETQITDRPLPEDEK